MSQPDSSARGVTWDLSNLFAGPDDPAMEALLTQCKRDAEGFAARYRGTIAVPGGPQPAHLAKGVNQLEELGERLSRVHSYAQLLFAADTANPIHRDLLGRIEQRITELQNLLLFFDLEWLELSDEEADRLISNPELANYRHYLQSERRYRPHRLSESEEKIINERDVTGKNAWRKLFTEVTSALVFPVERDGQVQDLTMSQTLALMYSPDRALRKGAHDSLYRVMAQHEQLLAFLYDTLVQDHLTIDRLRNYPTVMASRHLSNKIDGESVDRMMEVVEANYGIAQQYFRLKFELLGIDHPLIYDQYAPVDADRREFSFADSRTTVLEALEEFSPLCQRIARMFFDERWIDAELRPAKRGGAFCDSPSPQVNPYILCNYTDNLRDVMTVAHELGHGLHGYLSREQSYLNYHPSLPMAETASVFAEMLVFDYLMKQQRDPSVKLAMICGKIEDIFATVFRQNSLTRFEQLAFAGRSDGSRLTPEKLADAWITANSRYYGDSLELTEGYRWGWSYIPHFVNTPFYCYSYVFGELMVLALYRMYQEQGEAFVAQYLDLLRRGGSESPDRLLEPLGVDFGDAAFWQKGFVELKRLVEWAIALSGQ